MTASATALLIRPAAASKAARLTALIIRSKAFGGLFKRVLRQVAPELTASRARHRQRKVSVAELDERPVGVSMLDLAEPPELVSLVREPD